MNQKCSKTANQTSVQADQCSTAGSELLENAHYKFLSPYWEAAEIGFDKGRKNFRPQF
jgi:hypothetical protein